MASMHKLDDRITPHKNKHDVYFGRGGLGNMLRRYSMYRDLIAKNFESYRDSVTRFHQKRDFAQRRVVDEILRAGGKFFNEERTTDDGSKMEFKELNPEDKDDATLIVTKIMQAFRDMGRKGDRPDDSSRASSKNSNNKILREESTKKEAVRASAKKKIKIERKNRPSFVDDNKFDVGGDFVSQPLLSDNGAARCDKDIKPRDDAEQKPQGEESTGSVCSTSGGFLLDHFDSAVCLDSTSSQGRGEMRFSVPPVDTGGGDRQAEDLPSTDCVLVSPPASVVRPMNLLAAEQNREFPHSAISWHLANFRSIERQLSGGGFSGRAVEEAGKLRLRKKKSLPIQIRAAHPHFRRDMPNLLPVIQRLGGSKKGKLEQSQGPRGGGMKNSLNFDGIAGTAQDIGAPTGFLSNVQFRDDVVGRHHNHGSHVDWASDVSAVASESESPLARPQQDSRATPEAFDFDFAITIHRRSSASTSNLPSAQGLAPVLRHSSLARTEFESPAFLDSEIGMGHGKRRVMNSTSS